MDAPAIASFPSTLRRHSASRPNAPALLAPGRQAMSFAGLEELVSDVGARLRGAGIGRSDRVALVVENGPEAASAFLGITSASVCAPLNPAYRRDELEFYLDDLGARAVVVGASLDTAARDVARSLGLIVVEIETNVSLPAGAFTLTGLDACEACDAADPGAEALVLHTSGTTARPKIVPLTHGNLAVSAGNVARTLSLSEADRCLNLMPLFHIHGLVAALLASLTAGGSVACPPGFHQLRVFEWLAELDPTWLTAVPTMHQAILERGRRDPGVVRGHGLRFVRSSSASLPVPVLEGLEQLLGVPVIEAYGMTEAAHQMASNPLPPAARRPGSVGLPAGPEIAILDDAGRVLEAGAIGEVAIRGTNVFAGYESNPEANAASFTDGWFRTGDQGSLDADGYLTLSGRLKEIINRGGEKVSPLEVEDVLLRHPSVAQAVTFGVPHERLGEEVAAAIVLRDGEQAGPRELQDFVAEVLAPFKVPRSVVILDEIPKGPTGKLQRIGLGERIALDERGAAPARPHSPLLEHSVAAIWAETLGLDRVDEQDDFFALGGDSILAAEAVARLRELVGVPDLPIVTIVRASTPRAMAVELETGLGWRVDTALVPIRGSGAGRPLFLVHAVDGEVVRYATLSRLLAGDRPTYGLRAPGLWSDDEPELDIVGLAAAYLTEMRTVQPEGPYVILGYCMGAEIALELSHTLAAAGEVAKLVLVDPRLQRPSGLRYDLWLAGRRARQGELLGSLARRARRVRAREPFDAQPATGETPVWRALSRAREAYACRPTESPAALLRSDDFERYEMPDWYLRRVFPRTVLAQRVTGKHTDLFQAPAVGGVADAVGRALQVLEA